MVNHANFASLWQHKSRKKIQLFMIVLLLSTTLIIVVALSLKYKMSKCGERCRRLSNDGILSSPATLRRFSNLELLRATDQFGENNLIGIGSFGFFHRAWLHQDGIEVVIKGFHSQYATALKSFEGKYEVMKNNRHQNLANIINICSNNNFKA